MRNLIQKRCFCKVKKFKRYKSEISFITSDQCSLLIEGRLPKKFRNNSGLYIVRHSKGCVACDYSDQADWLRYYGEPQKPSDLPEGWLEDFSSLKQAVKWLLKKE